MDDLELDIDFILNSEEVKKDAEQIKSDLMGIGFDSEKAISSVNRQLNNLTDSVRKAANTEAKTLKEKQELIAEVVDEYKRLLEEGVNTTATLSDYEIALTNDLLMHWEMLKRLAQAQVELNNRYRSGAITSAQYKRSQESLTKQEEALKKEIEQVSAALQKQNGESEQSGESFRKLDGHVNRTSKNIVNFATNATKGFSSAANSLPQLVEEIILLRVETVALNAEGKKTQGIWKQIGKSLISWHTLLLIGITILVQYHKEIATWIKNIRNASIATDVLRKSQEALRKSFEDTKYKKVVQDVLEVRTALQLAREGVISKEKALKQYNETLGKSIGETNDLEVAEKNMVDKAPAYVKAMLYKAAAAYQASEAAKQLAENAQKGFVLDNKIDDAEKKKAKADSEPDRAKYVPRQYADPGSYDVSTRTEATAQVQLLEKQRKELEAEAAKTEDVNQKIITKLQKQAEEIAKAAGIVLDPDKPKGTDSIVKQRQALLDKIAALDREYARKQFTRDEEELQALRDKFTKVRELIERFNKENKKFQIDITGLGEIEDRAEEDLRYRQATRKLKEELDKQKKLYEDFEEYRKQFGLKKAKEEFKDRIGEFDSYLDYVKSKASENAKAFQAVADGTATGAQTDRVDLINQETDAQNRALVKRFNDQLTALMDYETKRNKLIEDYQVLRQKLIEKGYAAEAKELDKKHKEELAELDSTEIEKLSGYKELFNGIEHLSDAAARRVIANAKVMLETLRARYPEMKELIDQIEAKLKEMQVALDSRLPDRLLQVAGGFQEIANNISGMNDGLANTFRLLGDIVGQAANLSTSIGSLRSGIANFQNNKADGGGGILGSISAIAGVAGPIAGVVGAVTGVVSAVTGFFKRRKEQAEAAKKEVRDYYAAAQQGEREYQALLRQRELDGVAAGKSSYNAIVAQLDLLKKQTPEIEQAYNRIYAALQGEEYVSGKKYKHGTLFRKAKTYDVMASLQGADYDRLEKLYLQGKLKDQAKADFEDLRSLREELEAAGLDVEELQRQLNEMLTGTNSQQLSNALTELFQNGKTAAADLGKSFEEIMRTAIRNTFQYRYLEEQMMPFYDALSDLMNSGTPTQSQIDKLRQQYEDIGTAAADKWKQLQEITGIDLGAQDNNTSGLVGAIRRELTEQTGGELAGLTRNQADTIKRLYQISEQHYILEQRNSEVYIRQLSYQALIAENTAATVDELKLAVVELRAIKTNTKSQGYRDLGR